MLKFTGKVIFSTREERELPVKDKNGVPTSIMKNHVFVIKVIPIKGSSDITAMNFYVIIEGIHNQAPTVLQ